MIKKLIREKLEWAIANKIFPGAIVGTVKSGGQRTVSPAGHFTFEPDSPFVKEDSIFDVASITKSFPTASLALWLIDQGKLSTEDKLITYVPEFRNSQREEVAIWHLLTQTLDFGKTFLSSQKDKTPREILDFIFTQDFGSRPGHKYAYMNATSILLGLVVQKVAGKPLDILTDEIFLKPLQMSRTTFHPEKFPKNQIVPTEIDDWRGGLVHGVVHDETAYTLRKQFIPGHAGLFSTVIDLLKLIEILLNEGVYKGHKYFSKEIVTQMHTNQLESIGESMGLGWELNQPRFMGKYSLRSTFGKTAFTGCIMLCDIQRKIGYAMLSNTVHPKRPKDRTVINKIRSDIADIILGN